MIAKLEKPEAVDNLEAIVLAFDGVMVARGDLGVELPLEHVPLVQKRAIQIARENAKPVIVATQMLESMITNSRPTRAEASDVANAVLDGADAVMLSGETSVGRYPIKTVRTMAQIIEAVEDGPVSVPPLNHVPRTKRGVLSYAARDIGERLSARALVAFTQSGDTVRRLARLHTRLPLLAFTPTPEVRSQLAMTWGVETFLVDFVRLHRRDGAPGRPRDALDRAVPARRPRGHRRRFAARHGRLDQPHPGAPARRGGPRLSEPRRHLRGSAVTASADRDPSPSSPPTGSRAARPCSTGWCRLLDLEQLEVNLFRGVSPPQSPTRVFGGQVAGQALVAAGRTVPAGPRGALAARLLHPPGRPPACRSSTRPSGCATAARSPPAGCSRSSTARRSSRCPRRSSSRRTGWSTPSRRRDVPDPESLPDLGERVASGRERGLAGRRSRGRSTSASSTSRCGRPAGPRRRTRRRGSGCAPTARLPDDRLLHVCLLTYASDMTLLGSVLARHDVPAARCRWPAWTTPCGSTARSAPTSGCSTRATRPAPPASRGLATGRFTTRDGRLVATAVQEGLVRLRR